MDKEEHKARHEHLHKALDELLADFIRNTKRFPSQTNLIDFLQWSYNQTLNPEETEHERS